MKTIPRVVRFIQLSEVRDRILVDRLIRPHFMQGIECTFRTVAKRTILVDPYIQGIDCTFRTVTKRTMLVDPRFASKWAEHDVPLGSFSADLWETQFCLSEHMM